MDTREPVGNLWGRSQADVAQLVYRCLDCERTNNKILSAVDRQMIYGQALFEELSLTLKFAFIPYMHAIVLSFEA